MTYQPIIDKINSMNDSELVSLNNAYCQENSLFDNKIYENDEEFFNNFVPTAYEAVQKAFYGDYNFSHDYVKFNGYANLESFNHFDTGDLVESVEMIAEYIHDNQDAFDYFGFDFDECGEDEDEDEI